MPEGLSMFREAKPGETLTVEGQQNILFPEDTVNKYFIIYQKSKKLQTKANYIRKYMKYSISKINDFKFNLEHNNVNSVQRSRLHVMAHVMFFVIHR